MLLNCGVGENSFESPLDCKEIKPVSPKGNQSWIFIGRTDAEAESPVLWPPDVKSWLSSTFLGKTLVLGKIEGRRRGRQRTRWMTSLTWRTWVWASSGRMVKDREAWHAAAHGIAKSQTQLSNWTTAWYPVFPVSVKFTYSWVSHSSVEHCSSTTWCPGLKTRHWSRIHQESGVQDSHSGVGSGHKMQFPGPVMSARRLSLLQSSWNSWWLCDPPIKFVINSFWASLNKLLFCCLEPRNVADNRKTRCVLWSLEWDSLYKSEGLREKQNIENTSEREEKHTHSSSVETWSTLDIAYTRICHHRTEYFKINRIYQVLSLQRPPSVLHLSQSDSLLQLS